MMQSLVFHRCRQLRTPCQSCTHQCVENEWTRATTLYAASCFGLNIGQVPETEKHDAHSVVFPIMRTCMLTSCVKMHFTCKLSCPRSSGTLCLTRMGISVPQHDDPSHHERASVESIVSPTFGCVIRRIQTQALPLVFFCFCFFFVVFFFHAGNSSE